MNPLSDDQLAALLDDLESDRVERKSAWAGSAPESVPKAVCAFANDLPNHNQPGIVFIGANDDGTPSGIAVTDQLLLTLANLKSAGRIVPPPTMTVEKRRLKGADMAVIAVMPADSPPVMFEGRIWIRTGPRRDTATLQDERILNEKRRHGDRVFDTFPVRGCQIEDLSRIVFEQEYLPQAVPPSVLAANGRTYEERLCSMGMLAAMDYQVPTVVGLLALGKSPRTWLPGAYIQYLRIRGTQWGDPVVDAQEIDGTLNEMLRRLDEKLIATLSMAVDFTSGSTTEIRTTPYPLIALQQLARNAVMHRSYEGTNSPVRVYWFDDRIEIINPGGPYGEVTQANFGQPGINDYRNPNVATVLKTLGFVQRFGFGIVDARQALAANGNPPPEFSVDANFVMATIRKAP
ncbi:ATP-binding protein [Rhodoferax sp.]|uniref:ATP-binding protein n=1 Tax=Rhodoferax sp. TaxID=50421 RepID=UPI0027488178|nr:ATP-binding protein [Rhodoferax sp.]